MHRALPDMVDADGNRSSVTDVNGTVARFEMAYSPTPNERFSFGPPISQRLPSLLFLGFALVLVGATIVAYGGSSERLYRFIVVGGRTPLAFVIFVASVATVIRAGMRGVVITGEGIETRTLTMGFPRVKKFHWAQIDRVVLHDEDVLFELWNGTYERLPRVRKGRELAELVERVAIGRGRRVTRLDRSLFGPLGADARA